MTEPHLLVGFNTNLAPWIILFPLVGSLVLLFAGKRLGKLSGQLASAVMVAAFVCGVVQFLRVLGVEGGEHHENLRSATHHLFDWIQVGGFSFGADLLVDQLSTIMVLVVTGVGSLIHIYSISYMDGDPRYSRFFAYLNLFAASMLLLVLADNLLLMYVGWEGVGLCSYLLIGFWFEKPSASNAAKKAFLVNRIGDFSFLLGMLLLAVTVGSLSIGAINGAANGFVLEGIGGSADIPLGPELTAGIATIASLLLFGGATGKSAQIPLYVWLPDAMEGPTPVSALIHAATMVTAGVYMIARLSPVFELGDALIVVAIIGGATALWAALMACTEYDIKRVLAYSTVSQLGYMFLALGVGAYSVAIFHLVTHAFFKALMFLGAGAVMHGLDNETDMRNMGGLKKSMPIVGRTFMLGWLAICGIIPFSGFFSKDAILASAWADGQYILWGVGVLTAFLTAFYMSRMYFRVFEGKPKAPAGVHPHDAPLPMAIALIPLAVLSVVAGVLNLPGDLRLEKFLEPALGHSEVPHGITAWLLGGAALVAGIAGILFARSLYLSRAGSLRRQKLNTRFEFELTAPRNKFWIDEIYGRTIVLPGKALAAFLSDVFDRKVIDGFLVGLGRFAAGFGDIGRRSQTGYVRSYAAMFLIGAVVAISLMLTRFGA